MPGAVRVGRPNRIRHIPLSWPVEKRRSNHEPKFRPVGDAILRGREKTVGQVMEQMFLEMPSPQNWIMGRETPGKYFQRVERVAEPYIDKIAEELQVTFNEGALTGQDRIRASVNEQLARFGSPLRLTNDKGTITKAKPGDYRTTTPSRVEVGMSPKAVWAPIGVESFGGVSTASVEYATLRSGTLVTAMLEEQQRAVRDLIGDSFTVQQTFSTGRTITGLTAGQTASSLVDVLQEMSPRTSIAQNLATFRGVNAAGLTHPWEAAVYHRAEKMATTLAKQGVTGRAAYNKIQKDSQRYADKLRRSRARMISRTEIKRAQVHGQLSSMRQAVSDGLANPKTAGKKWVTGATDVCPVCSDLGFSRAIPVEQSFTGVGDGPPAHPNCRCDLDFVHVIDSAPQAAGAGDSKFPPGTDKNPIVWEFPSGFKTQPSVTRTFTPPRVPTVPKPSPKPPPARAPSARSKPLPPEETITAERTVITMDGEEKDLLDMVTGKEVNDSTIESILMRDAAGVADDLDLNTITDAALEATRREIMAVSRNTKPMTVYRAGAIDGDGYFSVTTDRRIAEGFSDGTKGSFGPVRRFDLDVGDIDADIELLGRGRSAYVEQEFIVSGRTLEQRLVVEAIEEAPRPAYPVTPRPDGPTWGEQLSYQDHSRTVRGRKEVSDAVVEIMDEVLAAPPIREGTTVEIIFRQKGPKNTNGIFNASEDVPTPRYPKFPDRLRVRNQSEWDNIEITRGRWSEAQLLEHFEEFGRAAGYKSVDEFVAAHHEWRAKVEAYAEAMDRIAHAGKAQRPTISIYEPEGMSPKNRMIGSRQNTFGHESFHSFDYRARAGDESFGDLRSSLRDAMDARAAGTAGPEHQAALDFLDACAESESLKMIMTGPYKESFKVYASDPSELGARAFSQWLAIRHGTPEMVADMIERTVTRHNGYQWTTAEFEESIGPALEALLRQWGALG